MVDAIMPEVYKKKFGPGLNIPSGKTQRKSSAVYFSKIQT